ncbi:serine hydrolase domain-containing protein [Sediminicola luteus]|uniref:Beta-lactamase-related domain-containing protein n=1 Tax=Sediminicola luteus TaxID=319238 RepID=A0A2A4GCS2_9FLAO|nr:serine hydrolase domain-containing protein [Sediminicola luteus]PCE65778.1 hypothetical protein B7P33_00280 [Sediminicola luteus]
MRVKLITILIGVHTLVFSQTPDSVRSEADVQDKLSYFIKVVERLKEKANTPGLALAVVYDNRLILKKTWGYRNLVGKLPVTDSTLFEIGSLGKAFTGVLMAQLVEAGELSWQDKVIRHIPEFKLADDYATEHATVQDLLTHRVNLYEHYFMNYGPVFPMQELLGRLPHMSFKGSFRADFSYSNYMYAVAGILQERVTQKAWGSLIKTYIFERLGMTDTKTDFNDFMESRNRAISYNADGRQIIKHYNIESVAPAGCITSSINDMGKWLLVFTNGGNHNHKPFIAKEQFDYITSPLTIRYPEDKQAYGIGWNVALENGNIFHNGSTAGQRSRLTFNLEKGYGIVVLANQQSVISNAIDYYATEIFLNNKLEVLEEIDVIVEKGGQFSNLKQQIRSISNKDLLDRLTDLAGRYTHPAYGEIKISRPKEDQFDFKYYDFEGTVGHKEKMEFTAFLNFDIGPEEIDFAVKEENESIDTLIVKFPYSKPMEFVKHRGQ